MSPHSSLCSSGHFFSPAGTTNSFVSGRKPDPDVPTGGPTCPVPTLLTLESCRLSHGAGEVGCECCASLPGLKTGLKAGGGTKNSCPGKSINDIKLVGDTTRGDVMGNRGAPVGFKTNGARPCPPIPGGANPGPGHTFGLPSALTNPPPTRTTKSPRRLRLDGALIHRVVPIRRHPLAHGKPASLVILFPHSTSLEMHRCVFAVPFFAKCTVALDALGEFYAAGGAESGSTEERIVDDGFAVARGRGTGCRSVGRLYIW